ncbi:CARDB domain-containing protein [Salinarchaeum laminariae]|uniref:CARDB domain-containing protein n=1 Tax=Salinarchaeum laminariae TaxID=869888 RepID=UPI0020BE26C9|nr:CARDB domain-containing protein [Salinarchaeum laminariae]
MSRPTIALVAFLVLAGTLAVAAPAAAAPDVDCAGDGGGTMVVADSGFTAEYNGSEPIQSELAYNGDDGIRVPDVNLSSSASSFVRVEDGTGPETCLAAVNADPGTIHVDPDGEQAIDIDGEVETLSFANADYGSGTMDLAYVSNGAWTLTLYDTGLSQGDTVEAIPSSGSKISTSTVGANGVLTLALPTGTYDVDLQQAGGSSQPGGSPQFSVASASADATEVSTGESVDVTAEIQNDGNASGQYTATLTADGQSVDSATVSVTANDAESVTLTTSFGQSGSYQLAVDGESAGTVTVSDGASVTTSDVSIDRTSVEPGENVTVSGRLSNGGSQSTTETVTLSVDGQQVASKTVQLAAGESAKVSFEHSFEDDGDHTVTFAGQQAGTVSVSAADDSSSGGTDAGNDGGSSGSGDGTGFLLPAIGVLAVLVILTAVVVWARNSGGASAGGDRTDGPGPDDSPDADDAGSEPASERGGEGTPTPAAASEPTETSENSTATADGSDEPADHAERGGERASPAEPDADATDTALDDGPVGTEPATGTGGSGSTEADAGSTGADNGSGDGDSGSDAGDSESNPADSSATASGDSSDVAETASESDAGGDSTDSEEE